MIHVALSYIRDILNENFRNEFSISEKKLVLSNIVKADGSIVQNIDGKIVFFLVNFDEEAALKNNLNRSSHSGFGSVIHKAPTLHLNLNVLFCANFDSKLYVEGLSYLSSIIRFFQANKVITIDTSPSSANRLKRLSFELCKLDYAELSHLWSAVGSKLMPSVLYKVGMVVFDDMPVERIIPSIKEL